MELVIQRTILIMLYIAGVGLLRTAFSSVTSRRVQASIWCISAALLLLPNSFKYLLRDAVTVTDAYHGKLVEAMLSVDLSKIDQTSMNDTLGATVEITGRGKTLPSVSLFGLLWCIGVLVAVVYLNISYIRLSRYVKKNSVAYAGPSVSGQASMYRRKIAYRLMNEETSPYSFGIVRPVVVLPPSFEERDETEQQMIVQHELEHIRRPDGVGNVLMGIVCSVYWYNPMVWVMRAMFLLDREMACDGAVLKSRTQIERKKYASMLVAYASSQKEAAIKTDLGQSNLQKRVRNIVRRPRKDRYWMVVQLFLYVGLTITMLACQEVGQLQISMQYAHMDTVWQSGQQPYEVQEKLMLNDTIGYQTIQATGTVLYEKAGFGWKAEQGERIEVSCEIYAPHELPAVVRVGLVDARKGELVGLTRSTKSGEAVISFEVPDDSVYQIILYNGQLDILSIENMKITVEKNEG